MDIALFSADIVLGALAFFSPCGFPMLPAYLAYYAPRGDAQGEPLARALARGAWAGALAALGAFLVIATIGALAVALGEVVKARAVDLELVGGLVVILLGALTLAGRGPRVALAMRPRTTRSALGVLSFGALYALAAAGCVAPVFLSVLVQGASGNALAILAYALGMGALLVIVTVLVAAAQARAVAWLRRAVPRVERASGVLLMVIGAYLVNYWASVRGLPHVV